MSNITVNKKHLDIKGVYVFCKHGIYFGLTPEELITMHDLIGELLVKHNPQGTDDKEFE